MINANNAFFIGRGLDYTLCMECALKLKEISYIHAEAYAAGELKHGTIALVSEGVPVIAAATQKHVYSKVISNIRKIDVDITDRRICDFFVFGQKNDISTTGFYFPYIGRCFEIKGNFLYSCRSLCCR